MGEGKARIWRSYTNEISHNTTVSDSASGIVKESLAIWREICSEKCGGVYVVVSPRIIQGVAEDE